MATGTEGLGSFGEGGFGTEAEAETFLTPVSPPPGSPSGTPEKQPGEQEERYVTGSSVGSSTTLDGTRTLVGIDPFGNPIYSYTPFPVPRRYYDLNPGWNTRGYIPEPIGPTMYLSYMSGGAVGAIVGLSKTPEVKAGYDDIILGWVTLKGVAHIISNGEIIHTIPEATAEPDPGAYNPYVDALTMRKTINRVEFFLTSEDGQEGEVKVAEATMGDDITYVSTALYLGGDSVSNEVLEYPDVVYGVLPALRGGIFESSTATLVMGEFPAMTGTITEQDSIVVSGSLPALSGLIAPYTYTYVRSELPALTGEIMAYSDYGVSPEFNYTFSEVPPLFGAIMVNDMTFATVDTDSPALSGFISDSQGAVVRGALPALRGGIAEAEFPDRLTVVSFVYSGARMIARPTVYVVFNSRMEAVATLDATQVAHMLLENEVDANSSATFTQVVYALLSSVMSAGDIASLQRDGMSVWALHMDSMGSTRYENYDFNSFMTLDGKTYGVNSTGIHLLEGNTDGADTITASVDFGSLNFGTNNRKAVPYVYIGMSSNGKTVLKVESDGRTYYYTARDSTALMKTHRFELGRGLRSNFYGFTLQSDGDAFDLHNIEFQPIELKRSL